MWQKYKIGAFVVGLRIGHICALSQLSLWTHNPDRLHSNYFSISVQIFPPDGPSIFFFITIHQVIWPSPGTLPRKGYAL